MSDDLTAFLKHYYGDRDALRDPVLQSSGNPWALPPKPQQEARLYTPERPRDAMAPVAEAISPTMGAYGIGQLLADTYGKAREGDWRGIEYPALAAMALPVPGAKRAPPRLENPIKAYHGSPHDFDKFDLSKIGTGEGAQAYGHGLYFAENPQVANSYKHANQQYTTPESRAQTYIDLAKGDRDKAIQFVRREMDQWKPGTTPHDHAAEVLPILESGKKLGNMYEVALHATPEQFLDWDKPLSGQARDALINNPRIRGALEDSGPIVKKYAAPIEKWDGDDFHTALQNAGKSPMFSEALREAGIPGIRYLDQQSRNPAQQIADLQKEIEFSQRAKKDHPTKTRLIDMDIADMEAKLAQLQKPGTSNYVVWSPEIIEILKKYGMAGAAPIAGTTLDDILSQPSPSTGYGQ